MTRVSRLGFAWAFISLIAIFCCHSLRQLWSGVGNHPSRQSLKERLVRKLLWKERFVDLNGGMVRLAGRRVCNSRMLYSDGSLGYQYSARHDSDGDFVKSVAWLAKRVNAHGIPFLYVQAPAKFPLRGNMMPTGWQFENPNNTLAHKNHTALEIMEQVEGPIHGFCSGIGTGGTITGIGEVLKRQYPDVEIWAVEPENAAILAGGTIGTHLQMGIGDGIIPDILNQTIYDQIYIVTDEEAIETSKRLAREEGLMVGISSGTNVAAAIKLAKKLGPGKTVVTVLPDTAERYFSTPLFDE